IAKKITLDKVYAKLLELEPKAIYIPAEKAKFVELINRTFTKNLLLFYRLKVKPLMYNFFLFVGRKSGFMECIFPFKSCNFFINASFISLVGASAISL
ncbi:hypothetical protein ACFL35_01835, partial [Candidatus Riflebacteria bacterium]